MRALVTGAGGFGGGYLTRELESRGFEVVAVTRATVDIRDREAVRSVVADAQPDRVYHLAAQSRAALSWSDPEITYDVNIVGSHNVLEAVVDFAPNARVLVVSTSDVYGRVEPADCPLVEEAPLRPLSPYGISKIGTEQVTRLFAEAFGLHAVVSRAFMHTGPGQPATFATSGWARRIAIAEANRAQAVIPAGRLDVVREFGDVRDVVRAYVELLESAPRGGIYNVATGDARPLHEALDLLVEAAEVPVVVQQDESLIRPADPPLLVGSAARLEQLTGWKPDHRLEDTLADVLDYWRGRAAKEVQT
jgi:GDP-4-dehydro-6-deoxy-D-mannose reductase